jgi:HEPN domain-containing protein
MKPLTREWIDKAEGDFATARREIRIRKAPNYDAVCFHAQQCVEKYLKARLQEADLSFGRTHDLAALLNLLLPLEASWETFLPHLRTLTVFAVGVRYPGESADKAMAREALTVCRDIRRHIRLSLGLEPEPPSQKDGTGRL